MYSMWTRSSLKSRAKSVLKGNYWKAFLVSLIVGLVNSGGGGASGNLNIDNGYGNTDVINEATVKWVILTFAIVAILLIIRLIIGYSLEVGGQKFFIRAAEGESDMSYLGYGFKNKRYTNILKTMFTRDLYLFFWTLLLIIPGIVKSYSYRMVPYILADNPQMDRKRAIQLSNQMTMGEKGSMFVLDLSFIGWYILGTFALFIGILFVIPYQNATNAELYLTLRGNAIKSGTTNNQELNNSDLYTASY